MKTIICPNCKRNVSVEDSAADFFCTYCGSKISVDKKNNVTVTLNVNENSCKTKRIVDEAKIQEIKFQEKKMNNDTGMAFVGIGILIGIVIFCHMMRIGVL